jgi:colanic acid biosynthesis glycosyl transferase WcaI
MRFLILTQYFPPEIGAPQTRLFFIARELIARGHQVEVVTALPNYPLGRIFPGYRRRLYQFERRDGVPVHRVWLYASLGSGIKRMFNYLSFTSSCLLGLLRSAKPDYLFIESPPLSLAAPGICFARFQHVSSIFNVADLWPDSVRDLGLMDDGAVISLAFKLERWAYKHSTFVNAMTNGIRQTLLDKGVPAKKILYLPNGVDLDSYCSVSADVPLKNSLGLGSKKVILYQGTLGLAQGLEAVLETAEVLRSDPDIHFLFVGNGSARECLEKLKSELQLENVTFHDLVQISELPRYLSICECGLVSLKDKPLFQGARPSKTNPILAASRPVIFFGAGEGADLIRDAKAGIVVPHGDIRRLAEAIRMLIRDPNRAAELGRNGRRLAEQHLSWSALVDNWLKQMEIPARPAQVA